jgi:hypothetical protein
MRLLKGQRSGRRWAALATFLCAAMACAPAMSFAARPLVTDDTGTVGKGNTQVELGVEASSREDTVDEVRTKSTGTEVLGVVTYGASETVDIITGFPYTWGRDREDGVTVFDDNGLSDLSFEVKWRFFEKNGLSFALKPGLTLPTGDHEKGFGTGRPTYRLTFIASKEVKPFAFHLNACYTRNENRVDERKDLWSASAAATYEPIKGLSIVGNLGLERNTDPTVQTAPAFALVGLNYTINDRITLDGGYKFGLNREEVDRSIIGGITLHF